MRSCLELVAIFVLVAGCGNDTEILPPHDDTCETSILTYENFGEPFMLDWCRGCHAEGLPADMRQGAPSALNFDDLSTIRELAPVISINATGAAPMMPPAAGPSPEERLLLAEWLACGAP